MCDVLLLGLEDRDEIELVEMACFNVGSITVTSVMDLDRGTVSDTLVVLCCTNDSGTLQQPSHSIPFITLANASKPYFLIELLFASHKYSAPKWLIYGAASIILY